jgi:CheY-like chemotaxis protein
MAGSGSNPSPGKDRPSVSPSPSEGAEEGQRRLILIAEDSRADLFLTREALAGLDVEIQVATDGEKALEFLKRAEVDANAPCPDLIILDINLPRRRGGDILRAMRGFARCRNVKVLIVTSSDSSSDREEMDRLGTNGYFHKPSNYREFMKLGGIVRRLLDEDSAG